jgi:hypothetical protein
MNCLVRQAVRHRIYFIVGLALAGLTRSASAANQTPTVSPVHLNSALPYKISLQPFDFGAASLPTLHSFAAGHYDGKWVLIAGRTNGLRPAGADR